MAGFVDKLRAAAAANESLLCVGLDPDPELMPEVEVAAFTREVVAATQDLVCAYKPNLAFYEALGPQGYGALRATLDAIPRHIPVIADGKRGDVASSARMYARALFEVWGFDAATVSPYLGLEAVEPFAAYGERGVLVLCRTSNPGSGEFQALRDAQGQPLYLRVAEAVQRANVRGNLGLVVGATHPEELRRVRERCPRMPLLVPGVGPQGGDLEAAVQAAGAGDAPLLVSASRQVLYASRGGDFAEAARTAALELRRRAQRARPEGDSDGRAGA